ncbi:conserved hypothetical protein [delta proteobacterium NaphS2]|nr:conserved hypothetical protein [delta proteobacterium NaphS2]
MQWQNFVEICKRSKNISLFTINRMSILLTGKNKVVNFIGR